MTDFIRTIWQSAAAAQSAAGAAVKVKTEVQPVDQIRLPPVAVDATTEAAVVEKQRLVKVEIVDASSAANTVASPASADASKAQRAARRDVVNARRDKRKTMSTTTPALMAPVDHTASPSAAASPAMTEDVSMDEEEGNDKLKKMKTGKTTSVVVSPSPAASPSAGAAPAPKKASSVSMGMLTSLTAELDPSGEERLRAMEAQLEHLDPDSKEAKKKRRLIRNRMSAQLHRERKKAYVGQLEDQLHEKERELKLLQEKLNAMAVESTQLKQKLSTLDMTAPTPAAVSTTTVVADVKPVSVVENEDVVIKQEPVFGEALDVAMDGINTIDLTSSLSENWADCLDGLDDIAEVAAEDLLSGLDDYPFGGYVPVSPAVPSSTTTHHEMHAAKKNLAMMMAVMFSMTFCGNTPAVPTVTNGSAFSSMFGAHPPKELSQMSIASRIVACLEKTSWEEFQDINSWTTAATTAVAGAAVAVSADGKKKEEEDKEEEAAPAKPDSPSAASDVTDSSDLCHSPKHEELTSFDPIDEFVYPVDDPLAGAVAAMDPAHSWFDDFGHSDVEDVDDVVAEPTASTSSKSKSMTSRLYEKLTSLWYEKNQVLLTVKDEKNAVTKRSVADMSSIRKGMESGALFDVRVGDNAQSLLAKSDTQAVTFLYPLSAFADGADQALNAAKASATTPSGDDVMFLEVSCQMNAASAAALSL